MSPKLVYSFFASVRSLNVDFSELVFLSVTDLVRKSLEPINAFNKLKNDSNFFKMTQANNYLHESLKLTSTKYLLQPSISLFNNPSVLWPSNSQITKALSQQEYVLKVLSAKSYSNSLSAGALELVDLFKTQTFPQISNALTNIASFNEPITKFEGLFPKYLKYLINSP